MTTLSVSSLAQSLGEVPPDHIIFGHSEVMQSVRSRLTKVAAANVPVLITGESGTGKDIIARLIHGLSPWKVRMVFINIIMVKLMLTKNMQPARPN